MVAVRTMSSDLSAALTAAVTAARTALNTATFQNPTDIPAKVQALADAEFKLAAARVEALQKIQNSDLKLNAEQLAYIAGGGLPGTTGGFGTAMTQMAYNDYSGFLKIFDGSTFAGWDGETDVWTIDNGSLHSDNSPGRPTSNQQHHITYVGPGSLVKDFHLKVEFKLTSPTNPNAHPDSNPVPAPTADAAPAGGRGGGGRTVANGGIQYRSRRLVRNGTIENPLGTPLAAGITTQSAATAAGFRSAISEANAWQVSGYQFDLDSANQYTGQLYEGQGRSIVTNPGKIVQLMPGGLNITIGTIADDVKPFIKEHKGLDGEWNQAEVICVGNTMIHMLNGHVISITTDLDPARKASQGIISVQLEGVGQVWYRNLYLKTL